MKRALLTHPKTLDLASRLGCSRPEAIGYLALLFDFCAEYAAQGDIGKWSNGAISRACDWGDEPESFIDALTGAVWLDNHDTHRLLIHDWSDNCDNWVRAKVKKLGLKFSSYEGSYEPTEEVLSLEGEGERGKGKGKEEGKVKKKVKEDPQKKQPYPPAFEDFWAVVAPHKRKSKADAFRRWKESLDLIRETVSVPSVFLQDRAAAYYASPVGQTAFCHGPAPWLHKGGWDDDEASWQRTDGPKGKPARPPEPARSCTDLLTAEEKIEYDRKLAEQNEIIKR